MLQFNKFYEMQNVQYGTVMNLYGNHSGTTIPNGNQVSLWPSTGSDDQQFMVAPYAGGARVFCKRNPNSHVLNRHSGSNMAIMWQTAAASQQDSEVDFLTVDAAQNLYKIKLIQLNLYLTAAAGASGMLYWQPLNGSNNQLFKLNEVLPSYYFPLSTSTTDYFIHQTYGYFRRPSRPDHDGIDLTCAEWSPIYAIADGYVVKAEYGTGSLASVGNFVNINHDLGAGASANRRYLRSFYLHMVQAPSVARGNLVTKGQIIGYVGNTGQGSTVDHLHFGLQYKTSPMSTDNAYRDADAIWFDPLEMYDVSYDKKP